MCTPRHSQRCALSRLSRQAMQHTPTLLRQGGLFSLRNSRKIKFTGLKGKMQRMKLKASCFESFCFPSPTESGVEEDAEGLLWLELLDEELWESGVIGCHRVSASRRSSKEQASKEEIRGKRGIKTRGVRRGRKG